MEDTNLLSQISKCTVIYNDITLLNPINTIEYDTLNLISWKKGQKLSRDQLIFLRSQLNEYGETVSSLSVNT